MIEILWGKRRICCIFSYELRTHRIEAVALINWIFIISFQFVKRNYMEY